MKTKSSNLLLGAAFALFASTAIASPAIAQEDDPTGPLFNCNGVTCEMFVCYGIAGDECAIVTMPDPGYKDPNGTVP